MAIKDLQVFNRIFAWLAVNKRLVSIVVEYLVALR